MAFLNPLFLLGLAAVAAPIIVHLVRRTRAPRVEFPSLMFVRKVPQRTIRRRRLTNLLLLLLRCAAFLLLVMAFIRPYFGSGEANENANQRATVILLDTSFSLRYDNRFDRAKKRAEEIVDQSAGKERLALIGFGQEYEIHNRFTTEASQIKSTLAGLQPGGGGTNYAQALRGAETLFRDIGNREKRIVLISDFQKTGVDPSEAGYKLSKEIKLVTVDLGEEKSPNLAIADVNVQPRIYQAKYSDKLTARIANYSDEAKTGVRVEFLLNDHTVEKREIKIEPRDATTVEFTDFNLNEGVNRGVIQIDGDNFPFDNKFNFTMRRAQQMRALAIETPGRGRSESFFLRSAMTTGENLPFALEIKTPGTVAPNDISQYRVVIVNDAVISPAFAQALIKFVEGGGGLILATGPHTDIASFNQMFQNVAPAKLEEAVQLRGASISMSEIKTDHPIFEVFRESGRLSAARVLGYTQVSPTEKSTVIARYENGSAALVESTLGSGKILLFTTTLDAGWNDLPLTPTYLPFVRQMARYLGETVEPAFHPQGQVFTVPAARDGAPPAVDAPNGDRITDRKQTPTGELIVAARDSGFYRLRYPESIDYAAVNPDSKESDFSKLNLEEFTNAVTGADPKATTSNAAAEKPAKEEVESRQHLWLYLLLASLLLFVTEAVLARRIKMARVLN